MALIDKASLLMVPSTYEAGKLYNVLPSGNRAPDSTGENSGYDQTRADFDFDRGSNTAATRVNADGLIEKYRENLLPQSNQFDTSPWFNGNTTDTSGQSGYDGSSNAWLITKSANSGYIAQNISKSGVTTFSVYAKANDSNYMSLLCDGGAFQYFDLSNGVLVAGNGIDAKIEAVGATGWYRCSMTQNANITRVRIYPAENGSTSSTSGSIYIQSAQLETSMAATDYLESTSVTGKAGVLIDLPRIDYSSGAGALLLEPSRQQFITQSEYLGGSDWLKIGNASVTANTSVSPDGYLNANSVVYDGTPSGRVEQIVYGLTSGSIYTFSVYVKVASGTQSFFIGHGAVNEAFTATTEWQRFSVYDVPVGTVSYPRVRCDSANTLQVWGAQLEQASYPTSYIPNHGESGGVTRAADSCSVTGVSDVIGQTEGTIYAEAKIEGLKDSNTIVTLHNGSFSEYLVIAGNSAGNINAYIFAGGVQQAAIFSGIYAVDSVVKCAMAYKENDVAFYINGVLIGTDSSATMASTSVFDVGSISFGNYPLHGTIKQATLFNERLSNAELAALTA